MIYYKEKFARRCFTLGWNHDIGYEFDAENHEKVSYEMVEPFDYKKAIYNHGKIPDYTNIEWMILNYADMTTSPKGEDVTLDERLSEIKNRYGDDNIYYLKALAIIDYLKKNFRNS